MAATAKWGLLMLAAGGLNPALQAQVTTRGDEVGRRLNEWFAKGTAAGLAKITYENRDGGHSALNTAEYPQLQNFKSDAQSGPDKGPADRLRRTPTIGNCSMAAPATNGGSLPRIYEMNPKGTEFLMMQYLANQMFVYPEHQDYDIGANGVGGYGDLYPVNNATVLISQGSSGSDQPFLNAMLCAAAALPPETQEVLIGKRILMPTLQAVFRKSNKMVVNDDDYFAGAAHPPVFDAGKIDELKMIETAHEMTTAKIPPLVQIQVVHETELQAGRDYFESADVAPYHLADTPVSIARILRGNAAEYEMTVSAEKSADLMRRPIQMRWVVLQGDASAVKIEPLESGLKARIRVRWQPEIKAPTGIRSHRVDIGVFATNGIAASTPAFLSFYQLPNEMHFHDAKGRVTEICYQAHNPDLGLPSSSSDARWLKVMLALTMRGDGLRSRLAERVLQEPDRAAIQEHWLELNELAQKIPAGDGDAAKAARKVFEESLAAHLDRQRPGKPTLREMLVRGVERLASISDLYPVFRAELDGLAKQSPKASAAADVRSEVRRLTDLGVLIEGASGAILLNSASAGVSEADRYYLRGLNLTLMSQVLFPEALERSTAPAWVDPRLTAPKPWRDVYRYEDTADGKLLGWVRHGEGRTATFNAEGRLLAEGFKHPDITREVVYGRSASGLLEWHVKP